MTFDFDSSNFEFSHSALKNSQQTNIARKIYRFHTQKKHFFVNKIKFENISRLLANWVSHHIPVWFIFRLFKRKVFFTYTIELSSAKKMDEDSFEISSDDELITTAKIVNIKLINCYWCKYSSSNLMQTKEHVMKNHMKNLKLTLPLTCNECPKTCSNAAEMAKHNRIHIANAPFGCNFCAKKYTLPDELETHHNEAHSSQKPFQCKICSDKFDEIAELKKHMQNHQTQLPFECKTCQLRFAALLDLKNHTQIHYQPDCIDCGKPFSAFASYNEYTLHKLDHSGEPPFECYLCDKAYKERKRLTQHMRSHTMRGAVRLT